MKLIRGFLMSEKLRTSKVFYSGFLLVLLAALLYLFKDYLMTMSIGILLAISTLSIQKFSLKISKNSQILATTITIIALFGLFCLPLFYLIFSVFKYLSNLDINSINNEEQLVDLDKALQQIPFVLDPDFVFGENQENDNLFHNLYSVLKIN